MLHQIFMRCGSNEKNQRRQSAAFLFAIDLAVGTMPLPATTLATALQCPEKSVPVRFDEFATALRFRTTQVVMQRKSCTMVVFSGSTSTAFISPVSFSNIASSTRNHSEPSPTTK